LVGAWTGKSAGFSPLRMRIDVCCCLLELADQIDGRAVIRQSTVLIPRMNQSRFRYPKLSFPGASAVRRQFPPLRFGKHQGCYDEQAIGNDGEYTD
jgi:hypothetical protein